MWIIVDMFSSFSSIRISITLSNSGHNMGRNKWWIQTNRSWWSSQTLGWTKIKAKHELRQTKSRIKVIFDINFLMRLLFLFGKKLHCQKWPIEIQFIWYLNDNHCFHCYIWLWRTCVLFGHYLFSYLSRLNKAMHSRYDWVEF